MGMLVIYIISHKLFSHQKTPGNHCYREQRLLGMALLIFVCCIALISIKTYLFINRYFVSILPIVYLWIALYLSPWFDKSLIVRILLALFLVFGLENFWQQHNRWLQYPDLIMPARAVSQRYRDNFHEKEMFVIAIEAFPPNSMPALYGFYVNKIYHMNIPVTELFSLDESTRDHLLSYQKNAIIWMPNCVDAKLNKLSTSWGERAIYVNGRIGTVCFLQIGPKEEKVAL